MPRTEESPEVLGAASAITSSDARRAVASLTSPSCGVDCVAVLVDTAAASVVGCSSSWSCWSETTLSTVNSWLASGAASSRAGMAISSRWRLWLNDRSSISFYRVLLLPLLLLLLLSSTGGSQHRCGAVLPLLWLDIVEVQFQFDGTDDDVIHLGEVVRVEGDNIGIPVAVGRVDVVEEYQGVVTTTTGDGERVAHALPSSDKVDLKIGDKAERLRGFVLHLETSSGTRELPRRGRHAAAGGRIVLVGDVSPQGIAFVGRHIRQGKLGLQL